MWEQLVNKVGLDEPTYVLDNVWDALNVNVNRTTLSLRSTEINVRITNVCWRN